MTRRFHNLSNAEGIAFQDPAQEQAMLRELESQLMDVDMQNCSQDFAPARPVLRLLSSYAQDAQPTEYTLRPHDVQPEGHPCTACCCNF